MWCISLRNWCGVEWRPFRVGASGIGVGIEVGDDVGELVGTSVGKKDGDWFGLVWVVGSVFGVQLVGDKVGESVGTSVGKEVGDGFGLVWLVGSVFGVQLHIAIFKYEWRISTYPSS